MSLRASRISPANYQLFNLKETIKYVLGIRWVWTTLITSVADRLSANVSNTGTTPSENRWWLRRITVTCASIASKQVRKYVINSIKPEYIFHVDPVHHLLELMHTLVLFVVTFKRITSSYFSKFHMTIWSSGYEKICFGNSNMCDNIMVYKDYQIRLNCETVFWFIHSWSLLRRTRLDVVSDIEWPRWDRGVQQWRLMYTKCDLFFILLKRLGHF